MYHFNVAEYYPNYEPEDRDKFEKVLSAFKGAETPVELEALTVAFVFDMSFPRQDIYVALRKVERERGWIK